MIAVLQRVTEASVEIDKTIKAKIGKGLVVLVGMEDADNAEDIEWLSNKIINLRIFDDVDGVMNVSVKDDGGDVIIVSQFTLQASTKKGNRPSYLKASKPDIAIPLYEKFIVEMEIALGKSIQTGIFGADMKIQLVNNGPVTIVIDSKNRV